MSDMKIPVPKDVLEFAKSRAKHGLTFWNNPPEEELKKAREEALAAIDRYKHAKRAVAGDQEYKNEFRQWLQSVDPECNP